VGCATGYVSKIMKEQLNCAVTGIEISPDAAKEAEKYCKRVIVGNIEEMDLAGILGEERFDVITFGDVLEHLKNPDKVLTTVVPFLVEGGYILASIPNIAHLSVALELLNGRFDYRALGLLDDAHLRFFTKKSILSLFRNAGYEIVLWDRVILNPEDTEFHTVLDSYPHSLLSFFESGNESLTYQFVVKAFPYSSDKSLEDLQEEWEGLVLRELRGKLEEKEKQLRERSQQLKEKGKQLEEKEEQLEQLRGVFNSWSWKITAPLRWIYKYLRREGK
jgi:SAM-dependent methyltransferase